MGGVGEPGRVGSARACPALGACMMTGSQA